MAFAKVLNQGKAKIGYRVQIEGLPSEFVSTDTLTTASSDGRERLHCLIPDAIEFSEEVDMGRAELSGQGMTLKLLETAGYDLTDLFAKQPTAETFLTATETHTATTIDVLDTSLFATSGVIYVGTEAIAYTGKTSTTFTGCTRAKYTSSAQYHYPQQPRIAGAALVTNKITNIEGRRCKVFAYDDRDLAGTITGTASGQLIFRGICTTDAKLSGDGCTWSIHVDPIHALLKQDFGESLEEELHPRGIYYSNQWPLTIQLHEYSTDKYFTGSIANSTTITFTGFYETQAAFVAALSTQLEALSWTNDYYAAEDPLYGWRVFVTCGGSPKAVAISAASVLDAEHTFFVAADPEGSTRVEDFDTGTYMSRPTSAAMEEFQRNGMVTGAGIRGAVSNPGATSEVTYPSNRLYVDGTVALSGLERITILEGDDEARAITIGVTGSDATDRYLVLDFGDISGFLATVLAQTTSRLGFSSGGGAFIRMNIEHSFGSGIDFASFATNLIADSIQYSNLGLAPFVTSADMSVSSSVVGGLARGRPYLSNRSYAAKAKVKLKDVFENECRLLGAFPVIDSNGRIAIQGIEPAVSTSTFDFEIDSSDVAVDEGFPTWERNADGVINVVVYKTGWNGRDHKGTEFTVRDVNGISRKRAARALTIEPRSMDPPDEAMTVAEWLDLARPVLGLYSGEHGFIEFDTSLKIGYAIRLGDYVSITDTRIPNTTDGTRGVTELPGVVVSRKVSFTKGRATIRCYVTFERLGGYAPCSYVSQVNSGNGTATPRITIIDDDVWSETGTAPALYYESASSTPASMGWVVGDNVTLWRVDSADTTNNRHGTISAMDSTTVTLALSASWTGTIGTDEWLLRFAGPNRTAAVTDNEEKYVHMGSAEGLVFTSQAPFKWAP